jgi:hypothetical protein
MCAHLQTEAAKSELQASQVRLQDSVSHEHQAHAEVSQREASVRQQLETLPSAREMSEATATQPHLRSAAHESVCGGAATAA